MSDHPLGKPITKLVYSYKDSSVPPQYHRSYTITMTKAQIHVLVDSYDEIIADVTMAMPEHAMETLENSLATLCIHQEKNPPDAAPCTGGPSRSLRIDSDALVLLEGSVSQCGGRLEGNLSGDIDAFSKEIESLIPDFRSLLRLD
jgi:hypothetical protein